MSIKSELLEIIYLENISKKAQKELSDVMASNENEESYKKYFNEYYYWIKNEFKIIDNSRKRYVFAIYDSKIIGFIRIWNSEYCNMCFIDGIDVKKEYHNNGIGYKLLKEGINEAKKINVKEITANINIKNIPSIKIHEKIGFVKIGVTKINSYGEKMNNENLIEYKYKIV